MHDWPSSKVVVVAGGGTGIGRAVASRVVSEGAAVVIGGRRADMGEEDADGLRRAGGRARFVATEVTVEAGSAFITGAYLAIDGGSTDQ